MAGMRSAKRFKHIQQKPPVLSVIQSRRKLKKKKKVVRLQRYLRTRRSLHLLSINVSLTSGARDSYLSTLKSLNTVERC